MKRMETFLTKFSHWPLAPLAPLASHEPSALVVYLPVHGRVHVVTPGGVFFGPLTQPGESVPRASTGAARSVTVRLGGSALRASHERSMIEWVQRRCQFECDDELSAFRRATRRHRGGCVTTSTRAHVIECRRQPVTLVCRHASMHGVVRHCALVLRSRHVPWAVEYHYRCDVRDR